MFYQIKATHVMDRKMICFLSPCSNSLLAIALSVCVLLAHI